MKAVFYEYLKSNWMPTMKAAGFKRRSWSLRRSVSPFIHCLSIQQRSDGKACCVNLGVHLEFLPLAGGGETSNVRADSCEIRTRLTQADEVDHWWRFDGGEPEAASLMGLYEDRGRLFFDRFLDFPHPFDAITPDDFKHADLSDIFPDMAGTRIALLLARVNEHIGNVEGVRSFAELGLELGGRGSVVLGYLRDMLRKHTP